MSQAAKAQEPSMEEILASIRRIIADDDAGKPANPPEPAAPKQPPVAVPPSPPAANSQSDVDAMLAELEGSQPAPSSSAAAQAGAGGRRKARAGQAHASADVRRARPDRGDGRAVAGAELPHHRRLGRRGVHRPRARAESGGAAARAAVLRPSRRRGGPISR